MLDRALIVVILLGLAGPWSPLRLAAQDTPVTPSQKTKEAVDKLRKQPATIGESLRALAEGAKDKLQEVLGSKPTEATKAPETNLEIPAKKDGKPEAPKFSSAGLRDPFRPTNLRRNMNAGARENLSPLERYELGQLKVVGIVWDLNQPKAMVEDTAGLGYIVKVGTPIGSNEGKVKAIHRNEIVVQEYQVDFYGRKSQRDVSMKFSAE